MPLRSLSGAARSTEPESINGDHLAFVQKNVRSPGLSVGTSKSSPPIASRAGPRLQTAWRRSSAAQLANNIQAPNRASIPLFGCFQPFGLRLRAAQGGPLQNLPGTSISASKPTFVSEGCGLISCSSLKPDSSAFEQSTDGARAPMTPKNIRRRPKLSRSANEGEAPVKMHNWWTTIGSAFTLDEDDSTRQIGEFAAAAPVLFAHDVGALAGETPGETHRELKWRKNDGPNICNRSHRIALHSFALLPVAICARLA